MTKTPETRLFDLLAKVVVMWMSAQDRTGNLTPMVGVRGVDVSGEEVFVLRTGRRSVLTLLDQEVRCSMSAVEDLIRMGYLRPTRSPGRTTFLRPTLDAIFLVDLSADDIDRRTFHQRYQRLRRGRK